MFKLTALTHEAQLIFFPIMYANRLYGLRFQVKPLTILGFNLPV